MNRWSLWGAALMFAGVAIGAFGAHGLKGRLTPEMAAVFETGVQYHLVHALGLFAVGWIATLRPSTAAQTAGTLLVIGVFLFSGSLYALAVTGVRALGAITPLGGLCFLAGWAALFASVWRA